MAYQIILTTAAILFLAAGVAAMNGPNSVNVSKLKTNQKIMQSKLSRHNIKQQQLASSQAMQPKFGGNIDKGPEKLSPDEGGMPIFELFVRRLKTGPWSRFRDIRANEESTKSLAGNIQAGGLEAEAVRSELDGWISGQLFGTGMGGDALAVTKVKEILPQFKKLKPREFEFGYRLLADGETVYSLERASMGPVAQRPKGPPPAARICIDDIAATVAASKTTVTKGAISADVLQAVIDSELYAAVRTIREYLQQQQQQQSNHIFIFSDGSATMGDAGGCVSGSCGVCIVPVYISKDTSSTSDGTTSSNASSPSSLPADRGTAGLGIGTVAAANAAVQAAKSAPVPFWDQALALSITDAGGLIDTPFDAELIAGLAAATMAKLLSLVVPVQEREGAGGCSAAIPVVKTTKAIVPMTAFTDSKTLSRAVRTGPVGYLAERASSSRLTLWKLLSSHISYLEEEGQGGEFESSSPSSSMITVEWIPGHPERRDCDRSRWSLYDMGIWIADELAKDSSSSTSTSSSPSTGALTSTTTAAAAAATTPTKDSATTSTADSKDKDTSSEEAAAANNQSTLLPKFKCSITALELVRLSSAIL